MSEAAQAAMTKATGWVASSNRNLFAPVLEAGNPRSGSQPIQSLVEACFLPPCHCALTLALCGYAKREATELSGVSS